MLSGLWSLVSCHFCSLTTIMKKLTASDIGLYSFCPRAWTLKQLGYKSGNLERMEAGVEFHDEYGRRLMFNRTARSVLWVLLLIVLTAAAALIIWRIGS